MSPWMAASALLQGLLFPPGLLLPALLLALLALGWGRPRLAVLLLALPAAATLLLSVPVVADGIATPLERRALAEAQPVRPLPRVAVVLGGALGMPPVADGPNDAGYDLGSAADRVVAAVQLWRAGRVDRLVFSGGPARGPDGAPRGPGEAELMTLFAGQLGVPRAAMVVEAESRTTRENARLVARRLEAAGLPPDVALVTSALHLPRALVEFRCVGLRPVGVPAEFEALAVERDLAGDWLPTAGALDLARRALKERVGALAGGC